MNGWQVVPKGLDKAMLEVALRYDIFHAIRPAGGRVAATLYQDIIAAAPTPPVVLPPLPKSVENKMSDFAVACARGGHEQRVDSANALCREIEAYARVALAQYGIKEQSDE